MLLGIAILPTAPHQSRNGDVQFSFRPVSDVYYLTHFPEPEAVAVLIPDDKDGKFIVSPTANQDTPISHGMTPLMGLDVWEHAYDLKYQNKRPDYIAAFYDVINWDAVNKNFESGK